MTRTGLLRARRLVAEAVRRLAEAREECRNTNWLYEVADMALHAVATLETGLYGREGKPATLTLRTA